MSSIDPPLPGARPPLPGAQPPLPGAQPPLPGAQPPLPGALEAQARRARVSGAVLVLALLLAFAVVLERVRAIAGGPLPPSVGVTAPDARGADLDGRPLSTRALAGQVLLVDFWATWCPPCVAAMPGLARLDAELGPRGFRVVGVNQDGLDVDVVRAFFREKGFSVSTIMDDGQIARAWAVFSFPTSFVVDRRGQIRAVHRGFVSADALRAELEPLLAEPAPAPSAAARAPGSSVVVSSGDPEGRSAEAR